MRTHLFGIALSLIMITGCGAKDVTPPTVTATTPANGAQDVDPSLTEITATFSEPMMDKSWSWCSNSEETFPELTGDPHYSGDGMTNTLPVKLKPDTEYIIWINSQKFKAFKDKAGLPAEPYELTFKTR